MSVGGLDAARWAGGDSRRSGKPGNVVVGDETWGRGGGGGDGGRTRWTNEADDCWPLVGLGTTRGAWRAATRGTTRGTGREAGRATGRKATRAGGDTDERGGQRGRGKSSELEREGEMTRGDHEAGGGGRGGRQGRGKLSELDREGEREMQYGKFCLCHTSFILTIPITSSCTSFNHLFKQNSPVSRGVARSTAREPPSLPPDSTS